MIKESEVVIHFKSSLDISYKDTLERVFFFNRNQSRYVDRVNQSIIDYSMPVIKKNKSEVSIVFKDEKAGQTLHILDSDQKDASLIGILMYNRDSEDTITLVHLVLHEGCNTIFKFDKINIAAIILEEFKSVIRKIKGVEKIRIYYMDKTFRL